MKISITKENKENKKGTKAVKIILCILFMLGVMFTIFTQWSNFTYGPVSGAQMWINLTSPTDGTDSGIYVSALTKALLPSVIITILFVLFVFLRFKIVLNFKNYSAIVYNENMRKTFSVILSLAVFFGGLAYGINDFKLYDLYKAYFVKSSFIEENYVEPKETKLIFPEKKRNVIYICICLRIWAEWKKSILFQSLLNWQMRDILFPIPIINSAALKHQSARNGRLLQ